MPWPPLLLPLLETHLQPPLPALLFPFPAAAFVVWTRTQRIGCAMATPAACPTCLYLDLPPPPPPRSLPAQVVWVGTQRIGCALATPAVCPNGIYVGQTGSFWQKTNMLVCEYDPPGVGKVGGNGEVRRSERKKCRKHASLGA